jgi:hypothetical protein
MLKKELLNTPQATVSESMSQAGTATASSKADTPKEKLKKKIVAVLVLFGFRLFGKTILGMKGIAFVAGFAACIWLIFRTVKGKTKAYPLLLRLFFLRSPLLFPSANTGNITQKQLLEKLIRCHAASWIPTGSCR